MRVARPFSELLLRPRSLEVFGEAGDPAAERRHLIAWLVRARTGGASAFLRALLPSSSPGRGDIASALTSAPGATGVAPVRGLKCASVCAPSDSWGSRPRLYDGAPIRGLKCASVCAPSDSWGSRPRLYDGVRLWRTMTSSGRQQNQDQCSTASSPSFHRPAQPSPEGGGASIAPQKTASLSLMPVFISPGLGWGVAYRKFAA